MQFFKQSLGGKAAAGAILLLALLAASSALAQSTLDWPTGEFVKFTLDSDTRGNPGSRSETVFSQVITIPDASWIRLYFDRAASIIEEGSFLRVTAARDGEFQELDAATLEMWNFTTAYFNGDTVYLELVAGPATTGNRVAMDHLATLLLAGSRDCGGDGCGICGADSRTLSTELWAGRLMPVGCTASISNTGNCAVTAGHCSDGGWDDTLQFNVPASTAGCATVNPPVADQFPITAHQFVNAGVGNDWSVMTVGTNNLGQTPYQRYGVYRPIATALANSGDTVSVWGYGVDDDNPTRNQVQQTHTGTVTYRDATSYGWNVDITYGNSGSALIKNNEIIGIVTHCSYSCENYATRVDVAAFAAARASLCGTACTDDGYEDNDTFGTATTIAAGTYTARQICPNDADYYRFNVGLGDSVQATINFTHSAGNLDLYLYNPSQTQIDSSTTTGNSETVDALNVGTAGYYYARVTGVSGAQNAYSLTLTITPPANTVHVDIGCVPASGTLPFTLGLWPVLYNDTSYTRTVYGRINVRIASGTVYSNWRSGTTNIAPASSFATTFNLNLPNSGALRGNNIFTLFGADVTASPFNQPPYPASGDTDAVACTSVGY